MKDICTCKNMIQEDGISKQRETEMRQERMK